MRSPAASIKQYLEERDYRPLYHLVCAAAIVAAACFLFQKNFTQPGMMMAPDMTWPDSLARLQYRTVNTWYPYGSTPASSAVQWFFWIYPSSMVARVLHLSAARYMFLLFLFTFSLAGISMYTLAYRTARELKLRNAAGYAPYVGAVFAGLVYMYNPWAIHYFRPYFAFPIYALMPLLFIAMVNTYRSPGARNIVLLALFATIANTSHNQTWLAGLFGAYFLFFLLKQRFTLRSVKTALKVGGGVAVLYLFLNAIWTLPYLGAASLGKPLLPFYSPDLTRAMLDGLSNNTHMMNNLRLLSIWSWNLDILGGGQFLQALTFSLPVLTVLSLILLRKEARRNSTINFWGALAVVALALATGTNTVLGGLYDWLVFKAPGSSTFGWLLRSPERFLFFAAPFVALMLGLLVYRLLPARPLREGGAGRIESIVSTLKFNGAGTDGGGAPAPDGLFDYPTTEERLLRVERAMAARRFRNLTVAAVLVIVTVLMSMYPKALSFSRNTFNPANVPTDYRRFNDFLSRHGGEPRVAWLPFFPPQQFKYAWAPEKTITWFSVMTSNPSLSSVREVMNYYSYFNWLQSLFVRGGKQRVTLENRHLMLKNDIMSRLFTPFSARYLVHDTSALGYDFGNAFSADTSLKKAYETRYLRVYETDSDPGYVWPAVKTVQAKSFYDNLALIQKLPGPMQDNLAFTDGRSFFGAPAVLSPEYGAINIEDHLTTVNLNPGFEEPGADGMPAQWAAYGKHPHAAFRADTTEKAAGKRSLRIENRSQKTMDVAVAISDELPVEPHTVYTVDTTVKYRNANWTNVSIDGYDSEAGKWIRIAQCPVISSGDSDWQKYRCAFLVPPRISKIRPVAAGGWVRDASSGNSVSWFDNIRISRVEESLYLAIMQRPPEAPRVTFKKINAEKYRVRVRGATSPFVLVQSESFDELWVARFSDGRTAEPIPMYATTNGYPINRTGDFDLVLEYRPQRFFQYGLAITALTLFACALILLYCWKVRPGTAKGIAYNCLSAARSWVDRPPKGGAGSRGRTIRRWAHAFRRGGSRVRAFVQGPPAGGRGR